MRRPREFVAVMVCCTRREILMLFICHRILVGESRLFHQEVLEIQEEVGNPLYITLVYDHIRVTECSQLTWCSAGTALKARRRLKSS